MEHFYHSIRELKFVKRNRLLHNGFKIYNREMRLLIATHNESKKRELCEGLAALDNHLQIVTLKDLHINTQPDETGKTFQENSLLKSQFYAHIAHLPTLADDGGLIIPYLNNEPGVRSRRWPGYEATDKELIDYCLQKLKNAKGDERTAYLETCLCFYDPTTKESFCEQERVKGRISEKPLTLQTNGYPFRALFIVEAYQKYYDQLTHEEHGQINHRLKALRRLVKKLKPHLLQ